MIRQPDRGTRDINESFYASEARRIALLNEVLGDVELSRGEVRTLIWLAGWEESTVNHMISVIRKVTANERKRMSQP